MNVTTDARPRFERAAPSAAARPVGPISVVVPVRNERTSIGLLLRSLLDQTAMPLEIIVVDGGSTDGTPDEVRVMARTDPRIRLIEAGPATPGRGRNVGMAAARSDWIALTDAGGWVEPRWLEELAAAAARHAEAAVVYGNYEPIADTFFTRCAAAAYVPPRRGTADGALRGPSTISMLLRRDAWQEAGGFPDLRAGEDLVFMDRLAERGIRSAWAPRATAWWQIPRSLGSTVRRATTYSRHNAEAGLHARWHHGVLRQYVVAAACVALGWWHDARWLLALPSGLALRAAVTIWRRRDVERGGRGAEWPARFVGVLGLLLALDAATFVGWGQAIAAKAGRARLKPRPGRPDS